MCCCAECVYYVKSVVSDQLVEDHTFLHIWAKPAHSGVSLHINQYSHTFCSKSIISCLMRSDSRIASTPLA